MPLKDNVIQSLRKTAGSSNVLTDPEDLYVYSFEQFFRQKRYSRLDAVVRVSSNQQVGEIQELAQKESIQTLKRSEEKSGLSQSKSYAAVLIDDVDPPELETLLKAGEKQPASGELEQEMHEAGYGSFRNYALALKSFFSRLPSEKCLTCKVCSGYCTVSSSFDNVETWSSKGRTILTRALSNNELQPSPKIIDVLYSCSLCGLCFAPCFESTQVRKAILDARHRIAEKEQTPELFTATAKNIFKFGDPSGMPPSKRTAWIQQPPRKSVFPKKASVLYWAGCVTSTRTPNTSKAVGNLLNRAEVDFTYLGEKEGCCGYVLLATGLWDEAKQNAIKLIERVQATHAEALVTTCGGCYYTFSKLYPEILGMELPLQVFHTTQHIEQLIKDRAIVPRSLNWRVTYHDPCSLGRHCGVFNAPRNIIKTVPNLDFVEMPLNQQRSRCCGAGGGLWSHNNTVATNCATERLIKDVAPLGISSLITACPSCHINLRNASARNSLGIKVYDVVEIADIATSPPR